MLAALESGADLQDVVFSVREHFRTHATYQLIGAEVDGIPVPFLRTTYPLEFVASYYIGGLHAVDAIARAGFLREEPFDWRDIPQQERDPTLAGIAREHGIAGNGYCWPLLDRAGHRGLFTINDGDDDTVWDHFLAAHRDDLGVVAVRFHRQAVTEVFGDCANQLSLTQRERECLQWTARGKSAGVIADILGLSAHTVRHYLKSARMKLNAATIQHAVALAANRRLL